MSQARAKRRAVRPQAGIFAPYAPPPCSRWRLWPCCGPWPAVAECITDHDLFALDPSGLRFGQRQGDNNLCSADRRPDALLAPVVAVAAP